MTAQQAYDKIARVLDDMSNTDQATLAGMIIDGCQCDREAMDAFFSSLEAVNEGELIATALERNKDD